MIASHSYREEKLVISPALFGFVGELASFVPCGKGPASL
jgi:hypothetical protein